MRSKSFIGLEHRPKIGVDQYLPKSPDSADVWLISPRLSGTSTALEPWLVEG